MPDFATVEDLNSRFIERDLTDAERAKAPAHLADASAIMRDRFPYLASGTPPETARTVCCAMVLRVLRNPGGVREEQVDDYRYVRDTQLSAGQLYLTGEEAEMLRPVGRSAFSIVPGAPAAAP